MINNKWNWYPDFNHILATCGINPTKEEDMFWYCTFIEQLKIYGEEGEVEDHHFQRLGFIKDTDIFRNEVSRLATVSQGFL